MARQNQNYTSYPVLYPDALCRLPIRETAHTKPNSHARVAQNTVQWWTVLYRALEGDERAFLQVPCAVLGRGLPLDWNLANAAVVSAQSGLGCHTASQD